MTQVSGMVPPGAQIAARMHLRFDEGRSHKEYHGIVALQGEVVLGLCAYGRVGSTPRHTVYFRGHDDDIRVWEQALNCVTARVMEKRRRGYMVVSFDNWDVRGLTRVRAERNPAAQPPEPEPLDLLDAPAAVAPASAASGAQAPAPDATPGPLPAAWWPQVREGVSWPEVVRLARHPATAVLVKEDGGGQVVVGGEHAVLVDRRDLAACDCTCGADGPCDHLRASAMLLSGALVVRR